MEKIGEKSFIFLLVRKTDSLLFDIVFHICCLLVCYCIQKLQPGQVHVWQDATTGQWDASWGRNSEAALLFRQPKVHIETKTDPFSIFQPSISLSTEGDRKTMPKYQYEFMLPAKNYFIKKDRTFCKTLRCRVVEGSCQGPMDGPGPWRPSIAAGVVTCKFRFWLAVSVSNIH